MESNQSAQSEDDFFPPRKSKLIDLLTKVNTDHPIAQKFFEQQRAYNEKLQKHIAKVQKPNPIVLPELKPIDIESFYLRFREAFEIFQRKPFNESANDSESRKLARTIGAYIIRKKGFIQSPLLNKKSEPGLHKGLMIIGDYGTGKTSILNTYHQMLRYALNNPLGVNDVEGTRQLLGRYKIGFGYHTANDVVKSYESIFNPEEKEAFWSKMSTGMRYFDDVMTENQASNYGKIELFKDILEMRYVTGAKTIISLNYAGNSVDETLDAFGNRYGERIYDRLFEMFNIIELKGGSLRK